MGILRTLTPIATGIGFVVMFAWLVLIVWLILIAIGEFRFNRILKRRAERDFEEVRSSWLAEQRAFQSEEATGSERFDTSELPINFRFHPHEDELDTDITAAVFDIRERYPNEFA